MKSEAKKISELTMKKSNFILVTSCILCMFIWNIHLINIAILKNGKDSQSQSLYEDFTFFSVGFQHLIQNSNFNVIYFFFNYVRYWPHVEFTHDMIYLYILYRVFYVTYTKWLMMNNGWGYEGFWIKFSHTISIMKRLSLDFKSLIDF